MFVVGVVWMVFCVSFLCLVDLKKFCVCEL